MSLWPLCDNKMQSSEISNDSREPIKNGQCTCLVGRIDLRLALDGESFCVRRSKVIVEDFVFLARSVALELWKLRACVLRGRRANSYVALVYSRPSLYIVLFFQSLT